MTLQEAIEHAEEVAATRCGECAEEHEQLAEWLHELQRARRVIELLKILRDGFKIDAQTYKDENAKLRDLVADMSKAFLTLDIDYCQACPRDKDNRRCQMFVAADGECAFVTEMRELGIEEVD